MTFEWLIAWWNLIFVIPLVMGLLYMGLYITTGITFGEGELDHDADADADVETDAEIDADVDAEADADSDADHHAPGKAIGGDAIEPSLLSNVFDLLGVGRVPFSVVLMTLLVLWGLIGLITNSLLWTLIVSPWVMLLIAVPVAAVGSATATGAFARLMGRLMPLDETTARPKSHLVGQVGEALYRIDERFGMVVVKDARGERYQLPCRVGPGAAAIDKGRQVLLVDYRKDEDVFVVREYELGEFRRTATGADEAQSPPAPARPAQQESAERA